MNDYCSGLQFSSSQDRFPPTDWVIVVVRNSLQTVGPSLISSHVQKLAVERQTKNETIKHFKI